jgi:hypothetical protein
MDEAERWLTARRRRWSKARSDEKRASPWSDIPPTCTNEVSSGTGVTFHDRAIGATRSSAAHTPLCQVSADTAAVWEPRYVASDARSDSDPPHARAAAAASRAPDSSLTPEALVVHRRITRLWNTLAAMRGKDRKGWRRVPSEYLAVMVQIRNEAGRFVGLTGGRASRDHRSSNRRSA